LHREDREDREELRMIEQTPEFNWMAREQCALNRRNHLIFLRVLRVLRGELLFSG
jgi:hypothetical protein